MQTHASQVPPGFVLDGDQREPAEQHMGPYYQRLIDGEFTAGLLTRAHHGNALGRIHGGMLTAFADYALCAQAKVGTDDPNIVTISLNCEFLAAAPIGSWLYTRARVTQRTGSMVFVQGEILHEGQPVLSYSGVGKRWRSR